MCHDNDSPSDERLRRLIERKVKEASVSLSEGDPFGDKLREVVEQLDLEDRMEDPGGITHSDSEHNHTILRIMPESADA